MDNQENNESHGTLFENVNQQKENIQTQKKTQPDTKQDNISSKFTPDQITFDAPITPIDIKHQHFKKKISGYNPQEVDAFLEQVANVYEKFYLENFSLKEQFKKISAQLEEYQKQEEELKKTLISAQKFISDAKSEANIEKEKILKQAKSEADNIIEQAKQKAQEILTKTKSEAEKFLENKKQELTQIKTELEQLSKNKEAIINKIKEISDTIKKIII